MSREGTDTQEGAAMTDAGTPEGSAATGAVDLDPLSAIQSFYPMVEALSRARGLDPDRPPHLAKITRTH